MGSRRSASSGAQHRSKGGSAAPNPSAAGSSDRIVRLQIFGAFVVPLLLLAVWLGSKGFFQTP